MALSRIAVPFGRGNEALSESERIDYLILVEAREQVGAQSRLFYRMRYSRSLKAFTVLLRCAFVLLGALSNRRTSAQFVEWLVAQGGNGHFYEVVSAPGGITWGNASLAATNRGGYLATITSAEENAFIFNIATQIATVWYSGYGPWLGGLQPAGSAEPGGGWRWVTGEPFLYKNWAPLQPNNNNNEDRIQFGGQADRSSAWNDISQSNTNFTRGFVVEYDRHPDAVTLSITRKDTDHAQLSWPSRINIAYRVEWTEDLGGQWTLLTTVLGNGATVAVDDFLTESRRIYRCAAPL
jgi:hypothetical protein